MARDAQETAPASAIELAAPRPLVLSGITGGLLSFVSRKPLGAIGAAILIIAVLLGGFRPGTRHFPAQGSARYFQVDPPRTTVESVGKTYWLGSDQLGRDTWSRLVYGARISLYVSLISVSIGVTLGALIGVVSAYFGGVFDLIVQRLVDAMMAFPPIILALAIVAVAGAGA